MYFRILAAISADNIMINFLLTLWMSEPIIKTENLACVKKIVSDQTLIRNYLFAF